MQRNPIQIKNEQLYHIIYKAEIGNLLSKIAQRSFIFYTFCLSMSMSLILRLWRRNF